MPAYETEIFDWGVSVSNYNLDKGNVSIETLAHDFILKDAQGKDVKRLYSSMGGWGVGGATLGGDRAPARLPKAIHLAYYDYQEDRFYKLDAELPDDKIAKLFKQKTVDIDLHYGQVVPKFNELVFGIGPEGFIMVWVCKAGGEDQVELASFNAKPWVGMTVAEYNRTGPSFPIADRWQHLGNGAQLEPETIARLKSGWMPSADYYRKQRIKYPWRYQMSGNAWLREFTETQGNKEWAYTGPWEIGFYGIRAVMRGVPETARMWFNDRNGNRNWVIVSFYSKQRVNGEPDITPVWEAFEKLYPKRQLEDNYYWPGEEDMATVDIHVSDDLKTFTATLIKGKERIALPIKAVRYELKPFAHYPANDTPPPAVIKQLQNGPDYVGGARGG